jgi:hypothetical protein
VAGYRVNLNTSNEDTQSTIEARVTADFSLQVAETCAVLVRYAAYSGTSSRRFGTLYCVTCQNIADTKVKGKVPHRNLKAYCAVTPKEFLHSSLEALHTER